MLDRAGLGAADCLGVCAGAAGASDAANRKIYRDILTRIGFSCPIVVTTDAEIALTGATGGEKGIMVISGTGSICLAGDGYGEALRVGGWGHRIGDEGSGYAIGRELLSQVARARDEGREHPLAHAALSAAYNPRITAPEIAALATVCIQAAEEGCAQARDILQGAAKELARLVLLAYRRKWDGGQVNYYCGGGVLDASALLKGMLRDILAGKCPDLRLCEPKGDALAGALGIIIGRKL